MIDWVSVENEKSILITMKDGTKYKGCGNGLATADDFEDPEEQYDTFFVGLKGGSVGLRVDDIQSVVEI